MQRDLKADLTLLGYEGKFDLGSLYLALEPDSLVKFERMVEGVAEYGVRKGSIFVHCPDPVEALARALITKYEKERPTAE